VKSRRQAESDYCQRGARAQINAAGTELLPAALLGNSTRKKRLSLQRIGLCTSSLLGAHNVIHTQKNSRN
jgi:hypothetical protein